MLTSHTNGVETPAFNPLVTSGQQHLYMCPASAAWRQTVTQELATHLGPHAIEGLYLREKSIAASRPGSVMRRTMVIPPAEVGITGSTDIARCSPIFAS